MRITIDFNHEEDFERIKKLIRKADKLEQEGRFKLWDAEIGQMYSSIMRSDVHVPIDAENYMKQRMVKSATNFIKKEQNEN